MSENERIGREWAGRQNPPRKPRVDCDGHWWERPNGDRSREAPDSVLDLVIWSKMPKDERGYTFVQHETDAEAFEALGAALLQLRELVQ